MNNFLNITLAKRDYKYSQIVSKLKSEMEKKKQI